MVNPTCGIPCLPSPEWYRLLAAYTEGCGPRPQSGPHPNRYTILTRNGVETLSIPVEGGRRALRYYGEEGVNLPVSLHGEWWRVHCGAISAAYGRLPYFPHYFPAVEELIMRIPSGEKIMLHDFNLSLNNFIVTSIFSEENMKSLKRMREDNPERYAALRDGYCAEGYPSLSILDSLFRFGPATIFMI